jgi:hypothetical protein
MAENDAFRSDGTGTFVTALLDEQSSIVELAVAGTWNRDLWLEAHRTMRKCLTSHPSGLVLNLLDLDDPFAGSAPLWFAMEAQAHRMTPPVPVAACVKDSSALVIKLNRLGARHRLALFADMPGARKVLASHRTLTDRVRFDLPPEQRSADVAVQIVAGACRDWDLVAVASRARMVVSELIHNAVEHAGTEIELVVTRLGPQCTGIMRPNSVLHLAVHDGDRHLPPLPHGPTPQLRPATERGQGLHIVDVAADRWGALPTRRGKMVWAVLRDRESATASPSGEPADQLLNDV